MPRPLDSFPRIAVVDDDPRMRRALELTLGRHGYETLLFESAEAFLERSPAMPPIACLLLDLHLPGKSGLDVLRGLRKTHRTFPIIMFTSETDVAIEDEALLSGATAFLAKGSSNLVLLAAIERAINQARPG